MDGWGKGSSGKLNKVVPGTAPKGRGTRRAGGRGAVAELQSSGTGWVGRPVSGGAGRASKGCVLQIGRRGERNKESLRLGHVVEKLSTHHTRLKDRHSDPLQRAGLFWVVVSGI